MGCGFESAHLHTRMSLGTKTMQSPVLVEMQIKENDKRDKKRQVKI